MRFLTRIGSGILAVLLVIGAHTAAIFAAETGPITAERAKEIALAQTGGGDVVELDRHYGGDGHFYRLEILSPDGAYHVEIDEGTGRLRKFIRKHGAKGYRTGAAVTPPAPAETTPGSGAVTQEQALAIALERTGGGTVMETEIDIKRYGRTVYEFEILNDGFKYEVDVDGATGGIVKLKQKRTHRSALTAAPGQPAGTAGVASPRLGMEAAQALAKEKAGGGTVTEYKLDWDDGRLVHEMKLVNAGTRYEVEIDDATGTFIEFSID